MIVQCSALDLLSALGSGSVGAVITDPPFFIPIGRDGNTQGGMGGDPWSGVTSLQEALGEVQPVVAECLRVLRPGGALVVMGQGIATTVWDFAARSAGLNWMAELTVLWNTGKPRRSNFGSLFTRIGWYSKPGARHTFNSGEQRSIYSNVLVCQKVPLNERRHPAQKPVGLTNFLVSLLTNDDDTVVDPYCGSGSTLVSAAICGRELIGGDTGESSVRIARARVDHFELEEVEPVWLWVNGRLEQV